MKKIVFLISILIIVLGLLYSCEIFGEKFTSWEHIIIASNYTDKGDYAVYRIVDDRFNTLDWYDLWMDDSFWDSSAGWSSFEGIYDTDDGRFYFEPEYYNGYVEWNAYSDMDIVGATIRFYRREYPE